jgi:hypothetical protein
LGEVEQVMVHTALSLVELVELELNHQLLETECLLSPQVVVAVDLLCLVQILMLVPVVLVADVL